LLKLPGYYKNSAVMNALLDALQIELNLCDTNEADTSNQFFVNSATGTLTLHENDVGLSVDTALSNAIRRTRIISRLRGVGTTTKEQIKNVALSFDNGIVDVVENYADYSITIKFVSTIGRPPNVEDFQKAVESIKPAHLAVVYVFLYNTCLMVKGFTALEIKAKTCYELLNEDL